MRRMAIAVFLFLVIATTEVYGQAAESPQEQVDRLVEGVRKRVNEVALAAGQVLKADGHLRNAEGFAAAGQHREARAELEAAGQIVAVPGRSTIQDDILLQDYVQKVRYAIGTFDTLREASSIAILPESRDTSDLFPAIQRALKAKALPVQLTAVVKVESGGDVNALSPRGARGLWQLMPDTARRYGLRVDDRVDDRLDPLKSTQAAVQYLRDLYDMFHDWSLALAAYNAGENRIQTVMFRTGIRRFTEMAEKRLLPPETVQYVPAVLNLMMR